MRYPLVDGQGNFGSVDGDPPAAMRYTEARLQALADEMMADLDKETVDFIPNYDETTEEPTVLPAPFPNLLVNGSAGIAVGMATNVPPHNLHEVIDGCIWLIEQTYLKPAEDSDGSARTQRGSRPARTKLKELIKPDPGPRLPDRRLHPRPKRHRPGVLDRPRRDSDARQVADRDQQEGRQGLDRHHRDPVSGQQDEPDRADRRPGAREGHRRDLRPARRVRSRRHADRHRAEARRSAGGRAQQPLQAHAAAVELRRHHARDRRRPAEGPQSARARRKLRRVPPRGRPPAHRVRAEEGRGALPHPRRPEDRARSPRRGDQADSRLEDGRRGARRPDDAASACRRSSRRPSSTCSSSA